MMLVWICYMNTFLVPNKSKISLINFGTSNSSEINNSQFRKLDAVDPKRYNNQNIKE